MLPHFIELNNRVMARFSAEERANIGVHTCPGGDRDSVHSADVPYNDLLPSMFKINAGYFLMQLASERDKDSVYESIGKHSRDDADGVAQMCYVGVINPGNPRVESRRGGRATTLVRAGELHPQGAPRRHRRLRVLTVQHRREAEPRIARLRPRGRVPEDHQPGAGHQDGRRAARHLLAAGNPRMRGSQANASGSSALRRAT